MARKFTALLLGMVLPAGVLAATTPVPIDLATSVQAPPIIMSGQPGCNLPPPPSLLGPGPETYSYGQASVTTGATGNHVFEIVALVTPSGAPADPAILLYQGAFNPANPATNLVACDDNSNVDPSLPPTFSRLVVNANTTYTVVVIVPEAPAFAPGISTATLSSALEPTITFADKSIALGAVGESMTATSNSTGTISYAIQNPAVALIDPGTGALTTSGTGSTLVAALQARDGGSYGSGFRQATLTVTAAAAAPTVTAISPVSGPTAGGTAVTITGTNFTGATSVTIGGVAATGFAVVSATTITATTPAGTAGAKDVAVTTPAGTGTGIGLYTYVAPAATKLAFITQPSGAASGVVFATQPRVAIQDANGNTVTTAFNSVALTIKPSTGTTGAVLTCTTTAAAAGVATFSDCKIDRAGTGYVLTATSSGLTGADSSAFNVAAAAPTVTGISPVSGSTAGGTAVTITGTNFTGATSVTIGGVAATGFAVVSATTITATTPAGTAGAKDVAVTTPAGTGTGIGLYTYVAPAATKLAFITQPSGAASGVVFATQPRVAIQDANGNTVTTAFNSVALTIKPSTGTTGAVLTCTTTAAVAGVATFSDCKIDRAGTGYVLTATSSGLTGADSSAFNVAAAAPTVTGISPVSGSTAGGTAVTITGTNFTGATSVTIGGVAATGFAVVSATTITATTPAGTAGAKDVAVTTPAGTGTGIGLYTYVAPAATKLAFITQPSGAASGVVFATQPRVAIQDANGNTVTTAFNSVALTIKPSTGTTGAVLTCTTTAAAAGVATFSDCKIDLAGTGYVLTASSGTLTNADSTAFNVAAPPGLTDVNFSVSPATAGSSATMTVQFRPGAALLAGGTITAKLTGYTLTTGAVTIAAESRPPGAFAGIVAAGSTDAVVVTAGTGQSVAAGTLFRFSFPVTNPAAGTIPKAGLTVATSSDTTAVASASDIVITPGAGPATKLGISTPPPLTMASGTRFSLTVTAQDAAGNVVAGHNGAVTIKTQSPGDAAKLKGFLTAKFVAGVASFTGLSFAGAGTYALVATSTGLTSAQSPSVTVTPPTVASYIAFTSGPAFEATGTAFAKQPVVTAYAADGTVFPLTGIVTLSASPATGTITSPTLSPAAALTLTFINGVATFSGVRVTASTGSYVLTATSGALSASTTFNVYADATSAATARATEQAQSKTFALNFETSAVLRTTLTFAAPLGASLCDALGLGLANCARLSMVVTTASVETATATSSSNSASTKSASAAKASCPTVVTGVGVVTVPPCMYGTPGTYRLVGTSPGFPTRTSNPITVVDTLAGNLPGAPRNIKVEVGDGQAVVSWDPPEATGAGRIVAYEVFGLRDGSADQSLAKGLLTSKTLKLANGSEWRFGVKALNALGGGEMARSNLVRIGAAPAAPKVVAWNAIGQAVSAAPKLTVGACKLQRAETVAVAPYEGPGTGAVMSYGATGLELADCPAGVANVTLGYPVVVQDMQVYTLVDGRWSMLPPATPGLVVKGDTATFAVADNGPSDADPQVGIISIVAGVGYIEAWLPDLPGAPQNVTTTTPGVGSVTVSWTVPATGGAPVRYRVVAVPGGASCVADAPATSCLVTGLTAGIAYTFTVVAENAAGAGSASAPSAATSPLGVGAVPVPTLGEYARILLALLLVLAAWRNRDRLSLRR